MRNIIGIQFFTKEELLNVVESAESMTEISDRDIKKVPALRGRTVINLFFEASTRTRVSFEIAAKRLSGDAINVSSSGSSVSKGETLLDTARNLQAMRPDCIVIRHSESGAPDFIAKHLPGTPIINAGDGTREHPTQALLDILTLKRHFKKNGEELTGKKIAIVGDILHSRVARSNYYAHHLLGNEVRFVGPTTLCPKTLEESFPGVKVYNNLREGITGVDVVIVLRIQLERIKGFFLPSLQEYTDSFCLGEKVISECCPKAVVLHPGPINRGVEVESSLVDGPRSLVTDQVTHGVAVRMACLIYACTGLNFSGVENANS